MTGAYLDHAATSPLRSGVLEAMMEYLDGNYANPSATYAAARSTRRAIDDARDAVAWFAGCAPDEVVFTSGGTEGDNLAIRGSVDEARGQVVVSAVEHDAVLRPARLLGAHVVPVDRDGRIDLDVLDDLVDPTTAVVSVIAVQSETGVVSPLEEVARRVHASSSGALLHTDAVQAARYFPLREMAAEFDLVTLSAHKLGGPKGVGALIVRGAALGRVSPLLLGGGQERDLRAGTENVAGIVGFAAAVNGSRPDPTAAARLRDRLVSGVLSAAPSAIVTAPNAPRSPVVAHFRFPGVAAEELLVLLDDAGVAASAGSACASGALEPSHVLLAMGWTDREAREAVRFTLGPETTEPEIDFAIGAIVDGVGRLGADATG